MNACAFGAPAEAAAGVGRVGFGEDGGNPAIEPENGVADADGPVANFVGQEVDGAREGVGEPCRAPASSAVAAPA